ncbi:MAG: glycine zipper 2TM domain-containing protein [Sulfitobacter sp.]
MRKFLLVLPMLSMLVACDTQTQSTLTGAAAGAAIGAAVSNDDDRVAGALIGGAAGAAAGNFVGRTQSGSCVYQRPDGSRYTAACP